MLDARFLLWLAAIIIFIITGILLIWGSSLDLRDGLGLACFGLAALVGAETYVGWRRP